MGYLQCMQVRRLGMRLGRVLLAEDRCKRLDPSKYPTLVSIYFRSCGYETYQETGFGRRTGKYQGDGLARTCSKIVTQINCTSS